MFTNYSSAQQRLSSQTIAKPLVGGSFSWALEREQLNPFVKPTNKHSNNGGSFQSGRKPTILKGVKFVYNVSFEVAYSHFGCSLKEKGWRLVNWDNSEIFCDSGTRY